MCYSQTCGENMGLTAINKDKGRINHGDGVQKDCSL